MRLIGYGEGMCAFCGGSTPHQMPQFLTTIRKGQHPAIVQGMVAPNSNFLHQLCLKTVDAMLRYEAHRYDK